MSSTHSQVIDAIDVRISTRSFSPDLIEEGILRQFLQNMDAMSVISGVRMTFVENHPELFEKAHAYGAFNGAAHVVVLSGPTDDLDAIEKAGFYGERLILTATLQGLATCWVDGSVDCDRAGELAGIPADEMVYTLIAVGYFDDQEAVLKQSYEERCETQTTHRTSLSVADLGGVDDSSAPWYRDAVVAVMKAPSARNKQPVRLTYISTETDSMTAHIDPDTELSSLAQYLCLGIAKLHAQIGAGADPDHAVRGEWNWGNNATFVRG